MRSIVTVASPASDTALTTLERVKLELGIPSGTTTSDHILQEKIEEASDDIEAALGFRLVRETAVETFWHEQYDVAPEKLVLDRTPVAAIASVVVDGVTIDASGYRLDPNTGELFALGNGYPRLGVLPERRREFRFDARHTSRRVFHVRDEGKSPPERCRTCEQCGRV